MIVANGKAAQFLGPARTADYRPSLVSPLPLWSGRDVGWYSWHDVEWMRRDPQCQFGLRILRGPLATVTWEIPASSPEVAAWVDRTLRKVWTRHLNKVTAFLEYGSCGGEITWRYDRTSDLIELDELLDLHILDMQPLQQHRKQVGVRVKSSHDGMETTDLFHPRYWWIANEPDFGAYHGRARLAGAWIPWQEKTARHGARDVRRLWYVKNVMDGGTLYVPPGTTEVEPGVHKANQDYGREIMEKAMAGGVMVLPNVTDEKGKRLWEREPPKINGELSGIHTLMEELDIEILVGMNIPPEVVQAADTGSGWSGRSVPFLVFLTSEDQLADTTVQGIDRCALRPGVAVNFGEDAWYEIRLKSLVKQAEEEEAKKKGMVPGAKPGETAAQGQEQKPGPPQAPQAPGQQPRPPAAPVRMSVQHAPPGGVTIGGRAFKGGEFIPSDVLANATAEEKAVLKTGKRAEKKTARREQAKAETEKRRERSFARDERKANKVVQAFRSRIEAYPPLKAAVGVLGQVYEAVAPLRKAADVKAVLNPAKIERSARETVKVEVDRRMLGFADAVADQFGRKLGKVVVGVLRDDLKSFTANLTYPVEEAVREASVHAKEKGEGRRKLVLAALVDGLKYIALDSFYLEKFEDAFEREDFVRNFADLLNEHDWPPGVPPEQGDEMERRQLEAAGQIYHSLRKAILSREPIRLSVQHAPPGGISIGGQDFKGGEFIPGDVLEKATPEERAALQQSGGTEKKRAKLQAIRRAVHAEINQLHGRTVVVEERPAGQEWHDPIRLQVEQEAADILSRGGKQDIGLAYQPRMGATQLDGEDGIAVAFVTVRRNGRVAISNGDKPEEIVDLSDSQRRRTQKIYKALGIKPPAELRLTSEEKAQLRIERDARRKARGAADPERLSIQHAPAGGITIGGQDFKGGEFIPGEVLEKATKEEKAALKAAPKANSFDKPPGVSGGHKDTRQFYKNVNKAKEQRPAHPDFHHPSLLHVESRLHELVSEAGHASESLYFDQRGRFVTVAGIDYDVMVVPQGENVLINSFPLHGPDPREPNKFVITPDTPSDEVEYRLRKALDLPVSREEANKYKAADRAVRESSRKETQAKRQERQRRKAAKAGDGADRLSIQHAPSGGVTIAGQDFKGGEFIPGDVLAKATPEERAALEGKEKPAADEAAKPKGKRARRRTEHEKTYAEYEKAQRDWDARRNAREKQNDAANALAGENYWDDALLKESTEKNPEAHPEMSNLVQSDEGRKQFLDNATRSAEAVTEAFTAGHGEKLVNELERLGFAEKDIARVKSLGEKGSAALKKTAAAYSLVTSKYLAAEAKATDLDNAEPEEPIEPEEPSVDPESEEDRAEHALWEKDHETWEKEHDAWDKKHDSWEEKSLLAREKADTLAEKMGEARSRLDELGDEYAERIDTAVNAGAEKLAERLDKEQEDDEEPEEPEEPNWHEHEPEVIGAVENIREHIEGVNVTSGGEEETLLTELQAAADDIDTSDPDPAEVVPGFQSVAVEDALQRYITLASRVAQKLAVAAQDDPAQRSNAARVRKSGAEALRALRSLRDEESTTS